MGSWGMLHFPGHDRVEPICCVAASNHAQKVCSRSFHRALCLPTCWPCVRCGVQGARRPARAQAWS